MSSEGQKKRLYGTETNESCTWGHFIYYEIQSQTTVGLKMIFSYPEERFKKENDYSMEPQNKVGFLCLKNSYS